MVGSPPCQKLLGLGRRLFRHRPILPKKVVRFGTRFNGIDGINAYAYLLLHSGLS